MLSVGFVSTYPPTTCGIATFTASLREAVAAPRSDVVALVDQRGRIPFGPEVVAELVRGSSRSLRDAAAALRGSDVVVVQHEFGDDGGRNGSEVLGLMRLLDVPTIVVAHTVLSSPTWLQRRLVRRLGEGTGMVIAQSAVARSLLIDRYGLSRERVAVVPHGAPPNVSLLPERDGCRRPMILTWGLLSRWKGIEYGIEALARLRDLDPPPRYVVLGELHPKVVALEGNAYIDLLAARARDLDVAHLVEFSSSYADERTVLARIREADVILLPYLSREQVVSGVLVEAIASGRPVVATRFPHAVELLAEGSGILVPHDNPRRDCRRVAKAAHRSRRRGAGRRRRHVPRRHRSTGTTSRRPIVA